MAFERDDPFIMGRQPAFLPKKGLPKKPANNSRKKGTGREVRPRENGSTKAKTAPTFQGRQDPFNRPAPYSRTNPIPLRQGPPAGGEPAARPAGAMGPPSGILGRRADPFASGRAQVFNQAQPDFGRQPLPQQAMLRALAQGGRQGPPSGILGGRPDPFAAGRRDPFAAGRADPFAGGRPQAQRFGGNALGAVGPVKSGFDYSGRDPFGRPLSSQPGEFVKVRPGSPGGPGGPAVDSGPVVDDTQYNGSMQQFIEQARQLLAGEHAQAEQLLAGQESAARGNAESAKGQIGKGYEALSAFIGGQANPINNAFQTGITQTGQIGQQAQQSINAGTQAAQAQQQAILARLGITDANVAIANNGPTLETGAAENIADVAQRTQLAQNEMSQNQQTELGYNTSMGTSAALEGQGQQNRIIQALQAQLADIGGQRTQMQSAAQGDILGLADQLYGQDMQRWTGNYDRRYQAQNDAMGYAQEMAELSARQAEQSQEPSAPPMNSTGYRALGPAGQANYALQQSGVDPGQAAIITRTIEEAYASGEVRSAADFIKKIREAGGSDPRNQIDAANAAAIYYAYFQ